MPARQPRTRPGSASASPAPARASGSPPRAARTMCVPPTSKSMKQPSKAEARAPEEYPVPDPKDATTPDKWVKRHPALVRLRVEIKRRGASPPSAES